MNIKDFLIDNYIWILIIIVITIITIIGFLADKKKGNNKEKDISKIDPNLNNQVNNNVAPMQYQQPEQLQQNSVNNNMNHNNIQPQPQMNQNVVMPNINSGQTMQIVPNDQNVMNVNNVSPMATEPQPVQFNPTNMELINNPQPVENIVQNVNPEPMYQPLSEQKPIIPPHPVPDFSQPQSAPSPIVDNNMFNANVQNFGGQQLNQTITEQNQVPAYNVMPQPQMENNAQNMISNQIPNQNTIPQPIPVPQPVIPQPIMQPQYSTQPMMQPNYNQPMMQQGMVSNTQPQQNMNVQQPINFVYGPQNNNQNM